MINKRVYGWMLPGYLKGLAAAHVDTIFFPLTEDKAALRRLIDLCDGILLTGGQDVNPSYYGKKKWNGMIYVIKRISL